jgi:hypothetical protein
MHAAVQAEDHAPCGLQLASFEASAVARAARRTSLHVRERSQVRARMGHKGASRTCVADEGRVLIDGRRGRRNAHARRHARGRGVALRARRVSASRKCRSGQCHAPRVLRFRSRCSSRLQTLCGKVRAGVRAVSVQRRASQRRTGKGATDLGVGQARSAKLFGPRVRWGASAQQRSAGGHGATGSTGGGAAAVLIVTLRLRFNGPISRTSSALSVAACGGNLLHTAFILVLATLLCCCSLARPTFFVKRVPHTGSRAARRQLQTERGAAQTITGRVTGADAGPQSSVLADGALARPPARQRAQNAFAPSLFVAHQRRQPRVLRVNGRRPAQPAACAARLCQPFCPRQRSADAALKRRLPQGAPWVLRSK